MGEARRVVDQSMVEQIGPTGSAEQVVVVLAAVGQHADPAVARLLRSPERREHALVAGRTGGRHGDRGAAVLDEQERTHRLHHRYFDALTLAGAIAVPERGEDRVGDRHAAHLVGHDRRHQRRHAGLALEKVGDAGGRLHDVVVGRIVGPLTVGRPAVRLAEHDVRPVGPDVVVGEAQPTEWAGPQVGDDDIARGGDAQERSATVGVLQVERDVALVAQQVEGGARQLRMAPGAHRPVGVAGDVLDRDHVGAEIAQDLRGVRPHDHRREIEHPNTVERAGRRSARSRVGSGHRPNVAAAPPRSG